MSKALENLIKHSQALGLEAGKIDMTFADTTNMPCEQMIKLFKKREDIRETLGFVTYLIKQNTPQEEEKKSSLISV